MLNVSIGARQGAVAESAKAPGLRILHVYRRFHPDFTGDGIYYQKMFPLFARRGVQQDVLVYEAPASVGANWREEQSRPHHRVFYLAPPGAVPNTFQLCAWLWARRGAYDVLHVHTHVDRRFCFYLFARLLGLAVLYSSTLEDSAVHLVNGYRPQWRWLVRRLMKSFNGLVAISPYLFDGNLAAFSPQRATFIPQGVAPARIPANEEREALRQRLGIAPHDVALLFLGSIAIRKAPDFLVRQLPRILASAPNAKLLLVGPTLEADYGESLRRAISELGLTEKVLWFGATDRPEDFYAAADIFVFASTSEGFGNVLLEAMSFRLPVVSRWLEGVTDFFILPGENGYLFRDGVEYCEAVLRLIRDKGLRGRIGANALARSRFEFGLERVSEEYLQLYRRWANRGRFGADPSVFHPFAVSGCRHIENGPEFLGMRRIEAAASEPPTLHVVVDTESDFDWGKGVADDHGRVDSIRRLDRLQSLCESAGAQPCYVVDYPVASNRESAAIMREMARRGAEVGAHLQPWTTPPVIESIDDWHAYPGNLSPYLERRKLQTLCETIRRNIGVEPRVYKAGRYGLSRTSLQLIEDLGFEVDLSTSPAFDYAAQGGPNYLRFDAHPRAFGRRGTLLELPTTGGFVGRQRGLAPQILAATDSPAAKLIRLRGVLDRTGLLRRVRLSPEGFQLPELVALTEALLGDGVRHFTLSLHSSSLTPGHTPYARNEDDVDRLLFTMEEYFAFFAQKLDGRMSTPLRTKRRLLGEAPGSVERVVTGV